MKNEAAIIADIQRASLHDGAGFRTTVFFKGCPMHCRWCHNPECIRFEPETLFYPEKCIGCGRCNEGCYSGARVRCGREMTADALLEVILQDRPYYGETGGVTFSGGEALSQPTALRAAAERCHAAGISTALETALYPYDEAALRCMDFIMADFKLWNDAQHRAYTGVSNQPIREHFRRLDRLGVPFVVRTPIIPGVTDLPENIRRIRDEIRGFSNIRGYELLPYNPLGNAKRIALGQEPVTFDGTGAPIEELKRLAVL